VRLFCVVVLSLARESLLLFRLVVAHAVEHANEGVA